MKNHSKNVEPSSRGLANPLVAPKKPTLPEVFCTLDAAQFPDDFLENRYADISMNPAKRDDD